MSAPVFDMLSMLDDWVNRSEVGAPSEAVAFTPELAKLGLVEVRG